VSTLVIDNIELLVTGEPSLGEGPLGLVRNAALVLEGDRVAAVEAAGAAADERIDAAGRCVIPGFVDSHTHLVFAGDRADEFAARMAGRPYAASGIRVTTEATRAASEDELRRLGRARRTEAAAPRPCAPGSPSSRSSPATGSSPRPSAARAPSRPSSPTT
jgi:imidazolonepropionase